MTRLKGKVKSIPLEEAIEGIQVVKSFVTINLKIWIISEIKNGLANLYSARTRDIDDSIGGVNIKELKTLVIVFETKDTNDDGFDRSLPLKYSQWQSAIDNGEVDSDKEVEFEIKQFMDEDEDYEIVTFAKIIPQKRKVYTREELRKAVWESRKFYSKHTFTPFNRLREPFNEWFEENVK